MFWLRETTVALRQRPKNEGWNDAESLVLELSNVTTAMSVARLTPRKIGYGTMMENQDTYSEDLSLNELIFCRLQLLQSLGYLWILMMGSVSYCHHGLLLMSL